MMKTRSPLIFKVWCSACYGSEIWELPRIQRQLIADDILQANTEYTVDTIAQTFILNSKSVCCTACGKKGTLSVQRVTE